MQRALHSSSYPALLERPVQSETERLPTGVCSVCPGRESASLYPHERRRSGSRHGCGALYSGSMKRIVDIVGSAIGLLVLSPVLGLSAIWIMLDSPGPVLFQQRRVGQYGRVFEILKFRTM